MVAKKPARGSRAPDLARDARGAASTGCGITPLFALLGKSHVLDILYVVLHEEAGPVRFVDLQRRLRMSPNTLSERLKGLVEVGFLTRTVFREIPPRVDYEATDKARHLDSVFEGLHAWAERHTLRAEPPVAGTA